MGGGHFVVFKKRAKEKGEKKNDFVFYSGILITGLLGGCIFGEVSGFIGIWVLG